MKNTPLWIWTALFFLMACAEKPSHRKALTEGWWRGEILTQGMNIPFHFEVISDSTGQKMILVNGEENLLAGPIQGAGDSLIIPMHIFDAKLAGKRENDRFLGYWIKNYVEDYRLPFIAEWGKTHRFTGNPEEAKFNISGKWDAWFINEEDSSYRIGIFEQSGSRLKGTFLSTTGDYRYLVGDVSGDSLYLSTFDGEHAYLFQAHVSGPDHMEGKFWSGKSWNQLWVAVRNERADLPDAGSLTFLNPGFEKVSFQFPGLDGKPVSPEDEKYKNKVLILQIFGTWCPNCMDETRFLADWYRNNRNRGVEIIGLAFERKDDFSYASSRVANMKQKLGVDYDFVIAGKSGGDNASKALPMLNRVLGFPTTIIIDREGKVRKIHTGFSGPGTGIHYVKFVNEFNSFLKVLLEGKEEPD